MRCMKNRLLGGIGALVLVHVVLVLSRGKRISIKFSGSSVKWENISYAVISGHTEECDRLAEIVGLGISSQEAFDEFDVLRRKIISEAKHVGVIGFDGGGEIEVGVHFSAHYIIFFNYDKSGIWLFEIESVSDGIEGSLKVGDGKLIDLREFICR